MPMSRKSGAASPSFSVCASGGSPLLAWVLVAGAFFGEEAVRSELFAQLRDLIRRSPRDLGYATSLWTLDLLAQACFEQGITVRQITGETIRATLAALGISWRRAKQRINSPDPHYTVKKSGATG